MSSSKSSVIGHFSSVKTNQRHAFPHMYPVTVPERKSKKSVMISLICEVIPGVTVAPLGSFPLSVRWEGVSVSEGAESPLGLAKHFLLLLHIESRQNKGRLLSQEKAFI